MECISTLADRSSHLLHATLLALSAYNATPRTSSGSRRRHSKPYIFPGRDSLGSLQGPAPIAKEVVPKTISGSSMWIAEAIPRPARHYINPPPFFSTAHAIVRGFYNHSTNQPVSEHRTSSRQCLPPDVTHGVNESAPPATRSSSALFRANIYFKHTN